MLLRRSLFLVLLAAAFAGLKGLGERPTGHEHGPIARAWRLANGDPEATVRRVMGKPTGVRTLAPAVREETFEDLGERVAVEVDHGRLFGVQATPNVSRPGGAYQLLPWPVDSVE